MKGMKAKRKMRNIHPPDVCNCRLAAAKVDEEEVLRRNYRKTRCQNKTSKKQKRPKYETLKKVSM